MAEPSVPDQNARSARPAKKCWWLKALVDGATIVGIAKTAGIGGRQARTLLNLAFVPPAAAVWVSVKRAPY